MSVAISPETNTLADEFAGELLRQALRTWNPEGNLLIHLLHCASEQSTVFYAAVRRLDAVAVTVDDGIYRNWYELEAALSGVRDYRNLEAYAKMALGDEITTA